jgi:ribosome-interacting GTPase 1
MVSESLPIFQMFYMCLVMIFLAQMEQVGIRLNKTRPDVTFSVKSTGGVKFNSTVPLTHLNEGLV